MTPTLTLRDIHDRITDLRAQLFNEHGHVKAETEAARQLRAEIGRLTQEARRIVAEGNGNA